MKIEKLKRVLIILVISIMLFNFIAPNTVNAETTLDSIMDWFGDSTSSSTEDSSSKQEDGFGYMGEVTEDTIKEIVDDPSGLDAELTTAKQFNFGGALLDGIAGVYTYLERVKVVIYGTVFQFLATVVGESAGTTAGDRKVAIIMPEDILFNRLAITDINFFNMTTFGLGDNQKTLSTDGNPIRILKENVASWYNTLRTMAIIISLVVLIYIGIRMAMAASSPDTLSQYKKMLVNWVVSLALVFLLHYIILFVISINDVLVQIIAQSSATTDATFWNKYLLGMIAKSFNPLATVGWASALVYFCLVALTFIFLIMYIKRMLTVAFLILISPLITITYSIDKIGNGRADALSNWLTEFLQNVLIQPFQCLIYVVFVSISMELLQESGTLAISVLAVVTLLFVLIAEGIIKQIFGITSSTTGSGLATAGVLLAAYQKFKPSSKPKVPSNVGKGNAGAGTKSNVPSIGATNNLNASTGQGTPLKGRLYGIPNNQPSNPLPRGQVYGIPGTLTSTGQNAPKTNKVYGIPNNPSSNPLPRGQVYGIPGTLNTNGTSSSTTGATANANTSTNANAGQNNNQSTANMQMPNVKNNNPRSDWEQFKDGAKGVTKGVANHLWEANKATSGLAGAAMGGVLAGLGGANMADIAGSMMVGKEVQNYVESKPQEMYNKGLAKWEEHVKETKIKNDERTLATAYSNYLGNATANHLAELQQARQYLDMERKDIENITNNQVKQYVQSLHAMRNVYHNSSEDDPTEKVIETMEKIMNKEILPND